MLLLNSSTVAITRFSCVKYCCVPYFKLACREKEKSILPSKGQTYVHNDVIGESKATTRWRQVAT